MTDRSLSTLPGSLITWDNTGARSCELVRPGLRGHLVPTMGWHRGFPSSPCSHTCSPWYVSSPHHLPLVLLAGIWERASEEADIQALHISTHPESQQGSSWGTSRSSDPLTGELGSPAARPSLLPRGTWECLPHCAKVYPFLSLPRGKYRHRQQTYTFSVS